MQLRLKFGLASRDVEGRVAAASLDETDRWAERILSAPTIEAVFADDEE